MDVKGEEGRKRVEGGKERGGRSTRVKNDVRKEIKISRGEMRHPKARQRTRYQK